ncbi:MAG: DegQ family serine endoprotease [Deltaproteobacteria bacterium]|nr:DegQ family serine endoprotease [Deltaproteobacteria bacterium]
MKNKRFSFKTLLTLFSVFMAATILIASTHSSSEASDLKASMSAVTEERPQSFSRLVKALKPAVVNISTTQVIKQRWSKGMPGQPGHEQDPFRDFFGDDFFDKFFGDIPQKDLKRKSLGSGFIISKDGYILTNTHVIENATEIKVSLSDEKVYEAEVVGRDPKTDIALIKIKANGDLSAVSLGNSEELEVGDWVIAIGNPFGLDQTVTAGIVSAKGRVIGAGQYDNFIQTDASINPGNSGGPLFNTKGEVVGINTMIFSPSGGNVGIGFAIPVNMAKELLPQLKEKGKVTRGWLGVMIQHVTPELAESFGMSKEKGALIADVVKGSPAEVAGIKRGDIVLRYNGSDVDKMNNLSRLVAATLVGKEVELLILREGKEMRLKVKIEEMKEEKEAVAEKGEKDLGMNVQDITPEIARYLSLEDTTGVIVTEVEDDSPAANAAIGRGDIIKEVNRVTIKTLSDYKKAIKATKGNKVLLLVKRGDSTLFVTVKVKE